MFTHQTTCRVIYADTDKMGFAYHANYFRWFEIGRAELFRSLGLSYKAIEEMGIFLPVSEVHCKFIAPVQYDDLLCIETTLDEKIKAGMKFLYRVLSQDGKKSLAKGYTKHPCVDSNGRVVRPPDFIIELTENHSDSNLK